MPMLSIFFILLCVIVCVGKGGGLYDRNSGGLMMLEYNVFC